jgi:hypothetical protein
MIFICSRGVDTVARPSVFFYEIVFGRILLGILWSISHCLLSIIDAGANGSDLLIANSLLDVFHAVVHVGQLYFHRYWCLPDGWDRLRQRNALQVLEVLLRYGLTSAAIASMLGNSLAFHSPDQKPYLANLLIQFVFAVQPIITIYLLRHRFHEGHVWFVFSVGAFLQVCCLLLGLLVLHFCYDSPIAFDEPFGYLGQVLFWAACSVFVLACHLAPGFARLYSGPGCADPTPIESLPNSSSLCTFFHKVPSVADSSAVTEMSPSLDISSSLAGIVPAAAQSRPEVTEMIVSQILASDPTVAPTPEPGPCVSIDTMKTAPNLAQVHPVTDAVERPSKSWIVAVPPMPAAAQQPANNVLLQVHRAAVFLIEYMMFGGLIAILDTIVAVSYPSLPRCVQSDPFGNEAGSAIRSLFDLFT